MLISTELLIIMGTQGTQVCIQNQTANLIQTR